MAPPAKYPRLLKPIGPRRMRTPGEIALDKLIRRTSDMFGWPSHDPISGEPFGRDDDDPSPVAPPPKKDLLSAFEPQSKGAAPYAAGTGNGSPSVPSRAIPISPVDVRRELMENLSPLASDPFAGGTPEGYGIGDPEIPDVPHTLGYETLDDFETGWRWPIAWTFPEGRSGRGLILQEIIRTNMETGFQDVYYEAWEIDAGGRWNRDRGGRTISTQNVSPQPPTDLFADRDNSITVPYRIEATARYYPGERLPPGFAAGNVLDTGDVPSSRNNPNLDTTPASAPVTRHFTLYPRSYVEQN